MEKRGEGGVVTRVGNLICGKIKSRGRNCKIVTLFIGLNRVVLGSHNV